MFLRQPQAKTTIRHGGPCGLQIEMRSAEREVKSVVFHAAGDRWYHAAGSEGGYGMIQTRKAAKPLSSISLILLWLATFKRPARYERGRKAGTPLFIRERGEVWPGRTQVAQRNDCAPSLSRRHRGIAAADINRLRLPLPDCALPDRSAGRAQQRQRVGHSDDRNHREGQC